MTPTETLLFILMVGLYILISLQQRYTNEKLDQLYMEKHNGNIR